MQLFKKAMCQVCGYIPHCDPPHCDPPYGSPFPRFVHPSMTMTMVNDNDSGHLLLRSLEGASLGFVSGIHLLEVELFIARVSLGSLIRGGYAAIDDS